jgi:glutamate--cysteine ligase
LVKPLTHAEVLALRDAVPRTGVNTRFGAGTLRDLAREVLAIAADGLKNRARRNAAGADEGAYLAPLHEIAAGGPSQAEHWLERYGGAWKGDASKIFGEAGF